MVDARPGRLLRCGRARRSPTSAPSGTAARTASRCSRSSPCSPAAGSRCGASGATSTPTASGRLARRRPRPPAGLHRARRGRRDRVLRHPLPARARLTLDRRLLPLLLGAARALARRALGAPALGPDGAPCPPLRGGRGLLFAAGLILWHNAIDQVGAGLGPCSRTRRWCSSGSSPGCSSARPRDGRRSPRSPSSRGRRAGVGRARAGRLRLEPRARRRLRGRARGSRTPASCSCCGRARPASSARRGRSSTRRSSPPAPARSPGGRSATSTSRLVGRDRLARPAGAALPRCSAGC